LVQPYNRAKVQRPPEHENGSHSERGRLKASAGRCAAEPYPKMSQTTKNTAKMTNKTQ
jgi:hypothetical protein